MYATLPSASVAPHFSHAPFSSSPISISILAVGGGIFLAAQLIGTPPNFPGFGGRNCGDSRVGGESEIVVGAEVHQFAPLGPDEEQ